ncbi:MAG: outer membrane protein assembly factor BamD [Verrucomicrobia bacterium]|nr:outer membrane protein assembly factor BamD [Verrucomicrobiota bacterium]
MSRRSVLLLLLSVGLSLMPIRSPAPLVYNPGEGWTYEAVGGVGKWKRETAKEQMAATQAAYDQHNYTLARKSASRLIRTWPLSDYAPNAQYLVGLCYEAEHEDERAFKAYQLVFEKYPRSDKLADVVQRQYQIGLRFLGGQRFKLLGLVPFLPDMDKTAGMFEKIVASGPYSAVGPSAQLSIGAARDRQKNYPEAVAAYERAADRYHDLPAIAADAQYRAGFAYSKQAQSAGYDQGTAGQAIATFTDFMALFPNDPRVNEAKRIIVVLKEEQSRGNYMIATFYENQKRWNGALIYYNEVLVQGPNSRYASVARERIDQIKKYIAGTPP